MNILRCRYPKVYGFCRTPSLWEPETLSAVQFSMVKYPGFSGRSPFTTESLAITGRPIPGVVFRWRCPTKWLVWDSIIVLVDIVVDKFAERTPQPVTFSRNIKTLTNLRQQTSKMFLHVTGVGDGLVFEPLTTVWECLVQWKQAQIDLGELPRLRQAGWTSKELQGHFGFGRSKINLELRRLRAKGPRGSCKNGR
jgi:hypothetical protein